MEEELDALTAELKKRNEHDPEIELRKWRLFKFGLFFHRAFGFSPEDDDFALKVRDIFMFLNLLMHIFIFTLSLTKFTEELNEEKVSWLIDGTASEIVSAAKGILFIIFRQKMFKIINLTKKINLFMKTTPKERKIALDWLDIQEKTTKLLIMGYNIATISYPLFSLFKGNDFPLQGHYPQATYEKPWFPIVFTISSIISYTRVFGAISNDCCCIAFICMLFSELDIVEHLVMNMRKNDKAYFKFVIRRHVIVTEYGVEMCKPLSISIFLQHVLLAIATFTATIIILYTDSLMITLRMTFMSSMAYVELLCFCLIGEMLITKSKNIAKAIENKAFDVFSGDVSMSKSVNFMLVRAQKPLRLAIGNNNTVLNLTFFSSTINSIYSSIMLFKTMM